LTFAALPDSLSGNAHIALRVPGSLEDMAVQTQHQRRIDPRVDQKLSLRIWGMDAIGKPFNQQAVTMDVSRRGARLGNVNLWRAPGEIIGVSNGDKKARFKVVWVGMEGSQFDGQIGVHCHEIGKSIWAVVPSMATARVGADRPLYSGFVGGAIAAAAAAAAAPAPSWTDHERAGRKTVSRVGMNERKHRRYECEGAISIRAGQQHVNGKLSDVSLGGCYVETLQPLPVGTQVEVAGGMDNIHFTAKGHVKLAQPMMGMGVEFTSMDQGDLIGLQAIIIAIMEKKHATFR
jgi:hypothetical protein